MAENPQPVTKAGSVGITKVGHTVGNKYGTNPLENQRGESKPSEITFGGTGGK